MSLGKENSPVITEELQNDIVLACDEVLTYDGLSPLEIRKRLAVPWVRKNEDGVDITLGHLTLGLISESFPDYIRMLKGLSSNSDFASIREFEIAVFLLVLKNHNPLNGARDHFTDNLTSWIRIQDRTLRAHFMRCIKVTREEKREMFYQDADLEEQLVRLTDTTHRVCIEILVSRGVKEERLYLTRSFLGIIDDTPKASWLDTVDGKDISYQYVMLDLQHGIEVS
jgi:hypothetical protein